MANYYLRFVQGYSRRPANTVNAILLSEPTRYHWEATQSSDPDTSLVYDRVLTGSRPLSKAESALASPALRRLNQEWANLHIANDVLFYQKSANHPARLVVPGSLIPTVLRDLHEQLGHVGVAKMTDVANKRYWWPKLQEQVRTFCRTCQTCEAFKGPNPNPVAPLQPMPTGAPGERVGIDIIGPLPTTERNNKYILVMVDYFTKAAEAEAIPTQDAETVVYTFFNRWVCQHGLPQSLHSDQGANFESDVFKAMCDWLGIQKTRTTPGHPQGNGQVERTNRTLVALLKCFALGSHPHDWDAHLQRSLLAYRATIHSSTGYSPDAR